MRVWFVSANAYLPDSTSGRESSVNALALRLIARGITVAVFAAKPGGAVAQSDATFSIDRDLGYPVYRAAQPLLAYGAALAAFQPDTAIIGFGPSSRRFVALTVDAGVKAVLHATSVAPYDFTEHPLGRPGVGVIANSPFTARRLETLLGTAPPVVLPLIEPERYHVDARGDSVVLINPTLAKGVETFFRLAAARPDIPFLAVESWTIGDAWRNVLMNRARALDNVALWPVMDDMREVYARARVLLVPSLLEETFGRVVAEAQVSGIPALVSDRGALPETLGGGGLVVPLDAGIAAWSEALHRLWTSPGIYDRCAAGAFAESVRAERQPERIADAFIDCLGRF